MITENKQWFVIITKPRAEKKVGKRLTEIGFENFVPLQRQLRQWHDRKKWVEVPIFGSYIFVKTDDRNRNKIFEVVGILRYLSIAGQVAVLKNEELERIKRLCAFDGIIDISNSSFDVGEEVEIIEGPFIGFRGILISTDNKNKLRVHFANLNCFATVDIDKQLCRKLITK